MTRRCVRASTLAVLLAVGACAGSRGSGPASATNSPVPVGGGGAGPGAMAASAPAGALVSRTQAEQGRTVVEQRCMDCHAVGNFNDAFFERAWRARTAADLHRQISRTMPEDAPASLSSEEYLAIVAFILTLNGFEAGDVGALDADALAGISLAPIAGS